MCVCYITLTHAAFKTIHAYNTTIRSNQNNKIFERVHTKCQERGELLGQVLRLYWS